jgi:hypothetical protein
MDSHFVVTTLRAPFVLRSRTERSTESKPANSLSPERGAGNAIVFVSNVSSSSQAGRRRFDPGLPLQLFSHLQEPLQRPESDRVR